MLPRSSGAPSRLAPPRQGRDLRKMILFAMGLVFVSYFVVVNVFFNLSTSEVAPRANALLSERHRAGGDTHAFTGKNAPVNHLKAQMEAAEGGGDEETAEQEEQHEQQEQEAQELEPETVKNTSWPVNPERKYVWLDVAIDDVPVGRVTMELYADLVPKTAENFRALTTGEKGPDMTFKNSICHRILTNFIVQCGDFTTGKGYGGRSIYGAKFADEPNGLRLTHSRRYILQMANSGPNTNGSQFCFMLKAAPHLNGKHVVFGHVVDGFDVVDKMEAAGVAHDGIPLTHKVGFVDGGEILFS